MSEVFPTAVIKSGNNIIYRLCDSDGKRRIVKEKFKPHLYTLAPVGTPVETADAVALRGLGVDPRVKTPLVRMEFDSIFEFKQYIDETIDVPGAKIYGQEDPVLQAFARAFPRPLKPDFKQVRFMNLDIEVLSSYYDMEGKFVEGVFPEPYIEEEQYRQKKFDAAAYAEKITNFYKWWNVEFPNSKIPLWTNMNAAYPISSLQLEDMQLGKYILWVMVRQKDVGTFKYDVNDDEIGGLDVEVREFRTEQEMLADFIRYWASREPDGWTGWNIDEFDAPYLSERILKILGEQWLNAMSPVGRSYKTLRRPQGKVPYTSYVWMGCPALCYMQLYKKHRLKERKRYSLDYISEVELVEKKVSYEEFGSVSTMYLNDFNLFCRYGVKDTRLVSKLNKKFGYLNLTIMLAAYAKCNYEDTLKTVRPWSSMIFSFNYNPTDPSQPRKVPQIKKRIAKAEAYDGAFVHTPVVGRHKNMLSEDLNSLYPHIEQQYNMGPETIVDNSVRQQIMFELIEELEGVKCDFNRNRARIALVDAISNDREIIDELIAFGPFEFETLTRHNVAMTPNLQFFYRDFPSVYNLITRILYSDRKVFKKEMFVAEQLVVNMKENNQQDTEEFHIQYELMTNGNTNQHGVKILMNSGYGAIGNKDFKEYFDPRIARGITSAGELVNKWVTKFLTEDLREISGDKEYKFVVYGDTDSIYINLTPIVEKFGFTEELLGRKGAVEAIDKYEKEVIQPLIKNHCQLMANLVNAHEQRMVWEREVICLDGGIFQAKKKYALLVDNSEGVHYPHPKLKIVGLSANTSTTPEFCVPWLQKCYELAILGKETELQTKVAEYKQQYFSFKPEEISIASSVSNVSKWIGSDGAPMKGTPYQAKASILHNKLCSEFGSNLPQITDGSKILIATLKKDNPYNSGYIAFQNFWPREFDEKVLQYIDYAGNFDKAFEKPLQIFLDAVKMSTKRKVNLFGFANKKG